MGEEPITSQPVSSQPVHQPDYVKPVFPGAVGSEGGGEGYGGRGNGFGAGPPRTPQYRPYPPPLDHPHYHQFEDEVCLKCDTARAQGWQPRLPSVPSVEVQDYTNYTPDPQPLARPPWGPSQGRQLPMAPGPAPPPPATVRVRPSFLRSARPAKALQP